MRFIKKHLYFDVPLNVVVIAQNRDFIGTKIIHIAFCSMLKKIFPFSRVFLVAPFRFSALEKDSVVDGFEQYEKSIESLYKKLVDLKADVVISLRPNSLWVSLAVFLSGAKFRVSYSNIVNRFLMTNIYSRDTSVYRLDNYMNLLRWTQGREASLAPLQPDLYEKSSEVQFDLILMPGGGAGDFKKWPIEKYMSLLNRLYESRVIESHAWVLGPDEKNYLERLNKGSQFLKGAVLNCPEMSELSSLCAKAKLVLANDCGPAHLAHIFHVPRVVLFSNYDGLVGGRIKEWFRPEHNALAIHSAPNMPINTISVNEVYNALLHVLAS